MLLGATAGASAWARSWLRGDVAPRDSSCITSICDWDVGQVRRPISACGRSAANATVWSCTARDQPSRAAVRNERDERNGQEDTGKAVLPSSP